MPLVGHVFDGEARNRFVCKQLMRERQAPAHSVPSTSSVPEHLPPFLKHGNAIVQLMAPAPVKGGRAVKHVVACPDWLHLSWRARAHMLDPGRNFNIGNMLASSADLTRHPSLATYFTDAHMDRSNKQSMEGALRMFDFQYIKASGTFVEVDRVRSAMMASPFTRGTLLYVHLFHTFLRIFLIKVRSNA